MADPPPVTTETSAYARGLERLLLAVHDLATAHDLAAIMAIVRRAARALTGADGASFVLRDAEHCHYADQDDDATEGAIPPLWSGRRLPIERCVSGWAMRHREPMVIEDVLADPRVPVDSYRATFVRSLAAVPIRQAQPVGAIEVQWAAPHRPAEATVRLLQELAAATATAMARAELVGGLEARVVERTQQLEAANRELEAFSYAVSHDLRAPLRAISGFSQILREDHADGLGYGLAHLDRIATATDRMSHLIDDLLRLAKLSRGELVRAPLDLAAIARELAGELRRAAPARQVELVIPDALPAQGDARLVAVVLDHLLRNAWKFTARRATARIELGARDGAFFVRDDGAGFDASRAHKLFVPFQRMHAAADFEGTGIGLAAARRIVLRHGGRIWAESTIDHGATFFFTLA